MFWRRNKLSLEERFQRADEEYRSYLEVTQQFDSVSNMVVEKLHRLKVKRERLLRERNAATLQKTNVINLKGKA